MAELIDIEGMGPDEAELLEATGWADVLALSKADIDVLERELSAANAMLKLVPRTPERKKIERWIAAAGRALDPGAPKRRGTKARNSSSRDRASDAAPGAPAAKHRRPQRQKFEGSPPPVQVPLPAAIPAAAVAGPVRAEDGGEDALKALSGPVNFEADPDVGEMLAVAPFALPLPARALAERGIAPSEIAVAPLLNRATGDLEVRVSVERPRSKELPGSPAGGRRAMVTAAVQVADLGFTTGRRGIDTSKVRTVEEAQGDAPPLRPPAPAVQTAEEERISLLRSPRPETNANRQPGSRFYIRGVLHDRPLKVWFGGLFVILLQFGVPLALLAAPLLILSDQVPEKFGWVPGWFIAFPVMVPLVSFLYLLVSTGAKCRVCAQRIYVPKRCLKNRKAHRLPLLGHIGALALHVMSFKWFNCTFCGTSIRIKK